MGYVRQIWFSIVIIFDYFDLECGAAGAMRVYFFWPNFGGFLYCVSCFD